MEIIAKISKGSRMDQIYIPKKRTNFSTGSYVIVRPLETIPKTTTKKHPKPYFYNVNFIEPIKLIIIEKIIETIDKTTVYENIIITGSFLDKGFSFNDIDIMLINKDKKFKLNIKSIEKSVEEAIGIKTHILLLDSKTLLKGLSTDPLYQMMLSKYVAKKRFICNIKRKINYKILDLHLLKSKILIENFDILNGNEKYYLTRNLIAIFLFLQNKKISKQEIDKKIEMLFGIKIEELKQNLLDKSKFLKEYKLLYRKIFNKIMQNIESNKNGTKQK